MLLLVDDKVQINVVSYWKKSQKINQFLQGYVQYKRECEQNAYTQINQGEERRFSERFGRGRGIL